MEKNAAHSVLSGRIKIFACSSIFSPIQHESLAFAKNDSESDKRLDLLCICKGGLGDMT